MNAALGSLAVTLSLASCLLGLILCALGAIRRDSRLAEAGRRAAVPTFVFATVALVTLELALLANDTSLRYVALHSASTSPTWVKVVSLWGALEGSILLWAWLLAAYLLVVARVARDDILRAPALATMFVVLAFFLGVNATAGSPFVPMAVAPDDGRGPNALLQNHWMMAVHPVLMYLGFVGLTVPFAYAVAALLTGRLGETWLAQTRRWTITAWAFLSAAVVAGGWWSYEVLGWGGYWAWDPVENASIIPWFLATAFLHSLQIQERRRMLKGWNLGLVVAAFGSTLLGTFLTRSGIVESVHAFAEGPIGPVFLGFLAFVLLGTLAIAYRRLPAIRDDHALDSPLSREAAFLVGNLLFSAFAFTVVLGTLFPVLVEAVSGERASVGAPFFNAVGVPLGLAILLLQGIGPALSWRRTTGETLRRTLTVPLGLAVLAGLAAWALGARRPAVAITTALAILNVAVIWSLTARAARERARAEGSSLAGALGHLVNTRPRRYGAYLAHLGVVVLAVGVAYSGGYKTESEVAFRPGETRDVDGVRVQYLRLVGETLPEKEVVAAEVLVDGRRMYPRQNYYGGMDAQPVVTPAIRYDALGDTYLTLFSYDGQADGDQAEVVLTVIRSPLVSWIWAGGLIVVIGAALTLLPAVPAAAPATRRAAAPAAGD